MARIEKTVFISYRRADVYTALAVYQDLKNHGYDVFFDYRSISSGDFEQIITSNIRARAHFLLILTPTALDRLNEPGDWLRREIEIAIDEKRNIIPLFFKGFRFGSQSVSDTLTGKLKTLSRYNGLNVHEDYFEEAMHRLRTEFLSRPLDTVLHPVSTEVRKVVIAEQVAADKALEQIENVQELVKKAEDKPQLERKLPKVAAKQPTISKNINKASARRPFPHRLVTILTGVLLLALCIWGGVALSSNLFLEVPGENTSLSQENTSTFTTLSSTEQYATYFANPTIMTQRAFIASQIMQNTGKTSTPSPTQPPIPLPPTPGIGSTMTGEDGMTLLYVPAGEFTMGSDSGSDDEKPVHIVDLVAFWIDETEVTNKMYAACVEAGVCEEPTNASSYTHSSYYGNSEFDDYPVIYVDWNMAKTYCEWVDRRLPTEAEWEKAARGENANVYPWGHDAPNNNLLNYNMAVRDTTEVGTYPDGASIYGAYDMAGNVQEWVNSLYQPYPYDAADGRESLTSSNSRVLRGGAFGSDDTFVRSASRNWSGTTSAGSGTGFRCAMSAAP